MRRFAAWFVLLGIVTLCAAQDDAAARDESRQRCVNAIRQTPQEAYASCEAYVKKYPAGDDSQQQFVQRWLKAYDKLQPYIQYLQTLAPKNQKTSWFLYEPDLDIELPHTFELLGPFKMEILRSSTGTFEESLLKKAEAAYSSPDQMIEIVFRNLTRLAEDPPKAMAPLWGVRGNDNLPDTSVITARAVRYYYDLVLAARQNPHLSTGFTAASINLMYGATIRYVDSYSHKQETFSHVYVAELTLKWAFNCGMMCGVGFTRNKVVVLDDKGNILAMYLDDPVNSQTWVS